MEPTPQERFNLAEFAISLTQPVDSGPCRLFIAAASIPVNDLRQLVTQFIAQLVASGEMMEALRAQNGTRLPWMRFRNMALMDAGDYTCPKYKGQPAPE